MTTAIVIVGYNRPESLSQLLYSLNKVRSNQEVTLIISIDNNGTEKVNQIADNYNWHLGPKKVIVHNHKKGLVKHFIWTGDQTAEYDTVIFLEDDLLVSPEIVNFVDIVSKFYKDDLRVAAASLYNPFINEITGGRFYQLDDGFDNYFLQQPYWGHIWFKRPWEEFQDYLKTYKEKKEILPESITDWTESFKKIFIQFLIERNKFVVTPRSSLVTNNGVPGLHSGAREAFFQSPICLEFRDYHLSSLDNSLSIYDSSYEVLPSIIKRYNPLLAEYDFEVDVNGSKQNYLKPFILTIKPVRKSILDFSSLMKPIELSVIFNQLVNSGLHLARKEDVVEVSSFYSHRRYNDIIKNYPIGVQTCFQLFGYGVNRLWFILISNFRKK